MEGDYGIRPATRERGVQTVADSVIRPRTRFTVEAFAPIVCKSLIESANYLATEIRVPPD